MMDEVEALRLSYRPDRITVLFVGESAPFGGAFFYDGNNVFHTYIRKAIEAALPADDQPFLTRFRSYGWYLDDLVITKAVNGLKGAARKAELRAALPSLRDRIGEYRPLAIVSLMRGIEDIVVEAAANSNAKVYRLPFPGNGYQNKFHHELVKIAPTLPREGTWGETE
jgi:hypothetical protein